MGPDGIGSYGDVSPMDDVPPVMWANATTPDGSHDGQVPSPDAFDAALEQEREDAPPVLASDPWPVMRQGVFAPPRRGLRPGRALGADGLATTSDAGDRALLGAAFVLVGVGAALGATKGGLFGSIAGALYGGATVNAVRAARVAKTDSKEAMVSGTFAIVGAGVATYLLWKERESSRGSRSKRARDDSDSDADD